MSCPLAKGYLLVLEWREKERDTDLARVDWAQYTSGDDAWNWEPACCVHVSSSTEQLEWNGEGTEQWKMNLKRQPGARWKVSKTMKRTWDFIPVREMIGGFGAEKKT